MNRHEHAEAHTIRARSRHVPVFARTARCEYRNMPVRAYSCSYLESHASTRIWNLNRFICGEGKLRPKFLALHQHNFAPQERGSSRHLLLLLLLFLLLLLPPPPKNWNYRRPFHTSISLKKDFENKC